MKYFDKVKLKQGCTKYEKLKIYDNMEGDIISGEIRDNSFLVCFIDPKTIGKDAKWIEENRHLIEDDIVEPIFIEDLELVKEGNATDELILEDIPLNNPKWWCKVEDGYIVNLLGEKKNKIPYDYNS